MRSPDTISDAVQLDIGVPQASVLGPLHVTIYMLPIGPTIRKEGISYHGYADDTQLYLRFDPRNSESLLTQLARLESCLDEICLWLVRNKLKLNGDKTEFIILVGARLGRLVDHLRPIL